MDPTAQMVPEAWSNRSPRAVGMPVSKPLAVVESMVVTVKVTESQVSTAASRDWLLTHCR